MKLFAIIAFLCPFIAQQNAKSTSTISQKAAAMSQSLKNLVSSSSKKPATQAQSGRVAALSGNGSVVTREYVKLAGFAKEPKVCLACSRPEGSGNKQLPTVLFMVGFGGPGGIYEWMLPDRSVITTADFEFVQAQWPGFEASIKGEDFNSDKIDLKYYWKLGEYYAALFKELKKRSGGQLHIVSHSNGGLKTLLAYLMLSPEDREGISVSFADMFIPSYACFFMSNNSGWLKTLLTTVNSGLDYNATAYLNPVKSAASHVAYHFDTNFAASIDLMGWKMSGPVAEMISNCFVEEAKIKELLAKTEDRSLDIRQIAAMTEKLYPMAGFGSEESYVKFLTENLVPKAINRNLKVQLLPHGHLTFVGMVDSRKDERFWSWVKTGLENPQNSNNKK